MPAQLRSALSAAVHVIVVMVAVMLANVGIKIPDSWTGALQDVLVGLAVAVYAFLAHWLSTRTGTSRWAVIARAVAKLMTLGLGALVPAEATSVATGRKVGPVVTRMHRP